jgi:hypothetical protein
MTVKQANTDKHFEHADKDHILQACDRMMRTNPHARSTGKWFPISSSDVGRRADYFAMSGFAVEKRREDAPNLNNTK